MFNNKVDYQDGSKLYVEQISTIPNITYFLLTDEQYKLYGKIEVE